MMQPQGNILFWTRCPGCQQPARVAYERIAINQKDGSASYVFRMIGDFPVHKECQELLDAERPFVRIQEET